MGVNSKITPSRIIKVMCLQVCSSSEGPSSVGHECGEHRLSRHTSHNL
jgi:hypothetical protein